MSMDAINEMNAKMSTHDLVVNGLRKRVTSSGGERRFEAVSTSLWVKPMEKSM